MMHLGHFLIIYTPSKVIKSSYKPLGEVLHTVKKMLHVEVDTYSIRRRYK